MDKKLVCGLLATTVFICLAILSWAATVPKEAQRHFDRGMAAVEMAKSPDDYAPAIKEFEQAIRLAPDWPDVYYNLGLIQEKAGRCGDAITSLRQYLRLAPNANDAATVKSLVNKLEFKAEQMITDEVALDIFASLGDRSMWQLKGISLKDDLERIRWIQGARRDERQIVITYFVRHNKTSTMRVTPHAKSLAFNTFYFLCEPSVQRDECPVVYEYSLEIVSRRYVKMSVKIFNLEIKPYIAAKVIDQSFEFVRK